MPMQQNQKKYHHAMQVQLSRGNRGTWQIFKQQSTENGSRVKYQYIFTPMLLGRCLEEAHMGFLKHKYGPKFLKHLTSLKLSAQHLKKQMPIRNLIIFYCFFYHLICLCFLSVYSYVSNWDNYNFDFRILHC